MLADLRRALRAQAHQEEQLALKVAVLYAAGCGPAEIAARLDVSEHEVRAARLRIKAALEAGGRAPTGNGAG